ncbi:hypothetical protein [Pontibacter rugosus]|uniref:DUF3127 domain-containing protein n=1 Tax=Pontibacter rugosus TaxID=1745966 RepID=A0ABW3SNN6_9BACT
MKLQGNILDIKNTRDSKNLGIEIHLDKIEYITNKKDGRYNQPFDFIDELETPMVITGDCLARINNKHLQDGEYDFQVYDKVGEEYVLNPDKFLSVLITYDFEADITILTSVEYSVTVTNEEFKQIKAERSKEKKQLRGKGRRS